MSYILEALKKAQAERQLGDVPTIHAPAIAAAPAGGAGLRNKPLVLALAALGLVTAGLLALVLRPTPPVPAAAPPVAKLPVVTPPSVAQVPVSSPVPAAVAPVPAPVSSPVPMAAAPAPAPLPVPIAAAPAPAAVPQASAPPPLAVVAPALSEAVVPHHRAGKPDKVAEAAPSAAVAATPAPPAQDEAIQNLRDLPEPIQRAIPPITMGGYMYSRNPADRLLLIDKVLRHEGEEVAPGLVLDKLLPKAAVFTFKGYRYRVPY
ncbi:general secretion pathway protein GspB [Duganella sp. LX20W]|uniref:General secretion pathway protein GspB n=1 Tax=Rugamonas brunnea TaxID=2758569 RepID=A0A7W2ER63_9BURK|nr:general secretion pathway protein GspB [Rugamonas brunnea]MBA5637010.1 general secretion pathway protein GspB [Rugamonas brunnea]